MSTLTSCVWIKNEACPIHVMQISPGLMRGKDGSARSPARLVKSEGNKTLVKKFRRRHADPGFNPTRVDRVGSAPFAVAFWTTLRFLEKGVGTSREPYNLALVKQKVSAR